MKGRLIIALVVAAFAYASYLSSSEVNEVTGEKQYIALSPEQEIALGLRAAPQMAAQYGGLSGDEQAQMRVHEIGHKLVEGSAAANTGWKFNFYLLADPHTINAFALPGGQVFITTGLYKELENDDQLAGVLAHEIGHVIARHGAQRLAKQNLTQGLVAATGVATGDYSSQQVSAMVGQVVNLKYGRGDELESDALGVRFMDEAGYNPNALIDVMNILAKSSGGRNNAEFFSSHPNPENRIEKIKEAIRTQNERRN